MARDAVKAVRVVELEDCDDALELQVESFMEW
jgi:hypothetical protein